MAYKGRRQAPRPGKSEWDSRAPLDPFSSSSMGDPFAGGPEKPPKGPGLGARWGAFWDSGKGKVLVAVAGCLAVIAVAAVVAVKLWIKPPPLPSDDPADQTQSSQPDQTDPVSDEPDDPTDDELYPDDGYMGDMPSVSGKRKDGVFTFLLVGTDMDDGNTDTIMVASYDTVNQDVSIMSIPRDTMINASWDIKKINSVYSRSGDGIDALLKRVKTLVGFTPDFHVKVDLKMFVELVDLVEGVEFDVPQDMNYDDPYQDLHIHLKKGVQVLDGEKAMELVRFRRYSEGDIKRVEVQQAFMKALIKECLSIEHWGKLKSYIDLAMDNVQTDLEFGSVVWFAANVLGLNSAPALNMDDVYTCTLPGDYWGSAWSRDTHQQQSYVTIYPRQVVELVNERFNPYEQKVTTAMLDAMSILSNGDIASSTGSLKDTRHNAIMAVQRGEAYYDDDGNFVRGTPPARPKQDENGNYYLENEDGSIVFTDREGNPLDQEPNLPEEGDNESGLPIQDPSGTGNDGTPSGPSGDSSGTASGNSGNTPDNPNPPDGGGDTPDPDAAGTEEPLPPAEEGDQTAPPPADAPDGTDSADNQTQQPPAEADTPPAGEPAPPPEPESPADNQIPDWLFPAQG